MYDRAHGLREPSANDNTRRPSPPDRADRSPPTAASQNAADVALGLRSQDRYWTFFATLVDRQRLTVCVEGTPLPESCRWQR